MRCPSNPNPSDLAVSQLDNLHFQYTIDQDADGLDDDSTLFVRVEVLPQVVPGYYQWNFTTEALATTTNFD